MKTKEVVFVLGMHRSGTSLVAELVHAMGYEVPGQQLEKNEKVNARGFWESRQVVDLNERLLADIGATWYQVGMDFGRGPSGSPEVRATAESIQGLLTTSLQEHDRLVIKDPRLCHLFPVWLECLDRSRVSAKVVWVTRRPLAVARSLEERDGLNELTGVLLWLEAFLSGLTGARRVPCLLLDFDRLLGGDEVRQRLSDHLGRPLTPEAWSTIVDPRLQHHLSETSSSNPTLELANACFESIEHGSLLTPETSRKVANLRKRFDRMRARSDEFIRSLAASNAAMVQAKRLAMRVGAMHAEALRTIARTNALLVDQGKLEQRSDRQERTIVELEGKLEERDRQVGTCKVDLQECGLALQSAWAELERLRPLAAANDERAGELEALHEAAQQSHGRVRELESAVEKHNDDMARNTAYIDKCHRRIAQLEAAMIEFAALRARLAEVESALAGREVDVARNTAYIDACHRRIAELDTAMIEFQAIRQRLAEVESALEARDAVIAGNAECIASLRQRVRELEQALPVEAEPGPAVPP
jgi:hypothetical protein